MSEPREPWEQNIPDDAQCPYCEVKLTPDNVAARYEGEAPTVFASENVPVYVLQCMECFINNKQDDE